MPKEVKIETKGTIIHKFYYPKYDVIVTLHVWKGFAGHKRFLTEIVVNTPKYLSRDKFDKIRKLAMDLGEKLYNRRVPAIVVRQTEEFFRHRVREEFRIGG